MTKFLGWLRQTTTVQGLAVLALTAVLQITQATDWKVVVGTFATSLVLLLLPGQGDLAGKVGKLAADVQQVAVTRGAPGAVGILASDGLVLAGSLHPGTTVIPVTAPVSVAAPSVPSDADKIAATTKPLPANAP